MTENPSENPVERGTGIPGMSKDTNLGADSYTTRESFKAFYQRGRYIGAHEGYGATISDDDRLFYTTREPVGVWWVKRIAYDLWDNWFRVKNPKDMDDESLDAKVQKVLLSLKARIQLPRETVFERRYGTGVLLCSYTGFGSETEWQNPLFSLNNDGKPPKKLENGGKLLQITPYPWTSVEVFELDKNPSSIRFGLPEYYKINQGSGAGDSTNPSGQEANQTINVHWTRIIHDAPRLDEHHYEGVPAIDAIFDDLVGGRNARWGAYETYYRHGTGFPVIKTNATAQQNADWVTAGGLDDYLNVRGYFICNVDEDFKFVGAEGAVLNPNTYFDMYFTFIAAATGVAKDTIQGVSAGRVTGSEVNERQYYKSISLHQNQKEPMLRELIDRIIQTGQVSEAPAQYIIEWVDPFEVNPQDKAAIEFMETRTRALKTWKTINEIRAEEGLEPVEDGDVLMLLPGQMGPWGSTPAPNQEQPSKTETEPEESEKNESTLLDRTINL
jgi:hypothetical protein